MYTSEQELIDNIKQVIALGIFDEHPDLILNLFPSFIEEWTPGERYEVGRLVLKSGIKYLILEPVVAHSAYDPSTINSRTTYKPYQGFEDCRWAYGEHVKIGMRREYEGNWYECIVENENTVITPDLDKITYKIIINI